MLRETAAAKRGTKRLRRAVYILDMPENQEVQMLHQPNLSGSKSRPRLPRARDEQQTAWQQQWQLADVVSVPVRRGTQNRQQFPPRDCSIDETRRRSSLRWRDRACTRRDADAKS